MEAAGLEAIPDLIEAISSDNQDLQFFAGRYLEALGADALQPLVASLDNTGEDDQKTILDLIKSIQSRTGVVVLRI